MAQISEFIKKYTIDLLVQHDIPVFLVICVVAVVIVLIAAKIMTSYIDDQTVNLAKTSVFADVLTGIKDDSADEYFRGAGLNMSLKKYNSIRFIVLSVFFVLFVFSSIQMQEIQFMWLALWIILWVVSYPNEIKFVEKTPFKLIMKFLHKQQFMRRDEELATLVVQLKNLVVAQKDNAWSGDFTISTIMRFAEITKPIFSQTLIYYREGNRTKAFQYFENACGTRVGRSFSIILSKLDELPPYELIEQLEMLQDTIREERETKQMRRDEAISNVLYTFVMLVCVAIIMNFIYIVLIRNALLQISGMGFAW